MLLWEGVAKASILLVARLVVFFDAAVSRVADSTSFPLASRHSDSI